MSHIEGHPRNYSTYSNHKCRCEDCRADWAAYCKRRKEERSAPDVLKKHGLASTYGNYKCRCAECRAAWATDCRERYSRRSRRAA